MAKTALVTGATGNIGQAVAKRLLQDGWKVVITGRDMDALQEMFYDLVQYARCPEAMDAADWIDYFSFDLTETSAVMGLSVAMDDSNITPSAVIMCHGIASKYPTSLIELEGTIPTNLTSHLRVAQSVYHAMAERGWGRIVFMSSIHGQQTYPERAAYAVCKGGLEALARVLALEWGPKGITTNCIAPGQLDKGMKGSPVDPEFLETVRKRTPTLKLATAEQVASLVAWLVSDGAAQVNGQTIRVDGGLGVSAWPKEFE